MDEVRPKKSFVRMYTENQFYLGHQEEEDSWRKDSQLMSIDKPQREDTALPSLDHTRLKERETPGQSLPFHQTESKEEKKSGLIRLQEVRKGDLDRFEENRRKKETIEAYKGKVEELNGTAGTCKKLIENYQVLTPSTTTENLQHRIGQETKTQSETGGTPGVGQVRLPLQRSRPSISPPQRRTGPGP